MIKPWPFRLGADGFFLLSPEEPIFLPAASLIPVWDAPVQPNSTVARGNPPPVAHEAEPAAAEPPPAQSQAELDAFAQYAQLFDGFDGDQALRDLLGSDWAMSHGWGEAGFAPLG